MRYAVLFLLLAACSGPSLAFRNAETQAVEVGGSTFTVHRLGDRVEVHRTGFEWLPSKAGVFRRSVTAIRLTTGCGIAAGTLEGDQSIQRAELVC